MILLSALFLIGLCSMYAATLTYEAVTDGSVSSPNYTLLPWPDGSNETVDLPYFDSAMGTLTRVDITVSNYLRQSISVTNTGAAPANTRVRAGCDAYWNGVRNQGIDTPDILIQYNTGYQDYAIGETKDWNNVESNSSQFFSYTQSSDLAYFSNSGNFQMTIWTEEAVTLSGTTSNIEVVLTANAYAYAKVVYTYDPTLPVELSSFSAMQTSTNDAEILWETQSETDHIGFNILKNESESSESSQKVNAVIIPSSNSSMGGEYSFVDDDVDEEVTYYYWLESVSFGGNVELYGPVSVRIEFTDDEEDDDAPQEAYAINEIKSVYPNPFNPSTTIKYNIVEDSNVLLEVYNIKGQRVKTLVNEYKDAESYNVVWNGKTDSGNDVSSGVYFIKLQTENQVFTKKVVLMK